MSGCFNLIIDCISSKSPLQKKKLDKYLCKRPLEFFAEAESFAANYMDYLSEQNISLSYAVDSYLKMCNDMIKSQLHFMRTGNYPVEISSQAVANVYNDEVEMTSYMIGLAMSQFLWSTHYEMYKFFDVHFRRLLDNIDSYAEVGPGHGLFLKKALQYLGNKKPVVVIDISPVSMSITQSIISYFMPKRKNITYLNMDMLDFESTDNFDFITMGEVLEHVDNPDKLLIKLNSLLTRRGRAYISTCVNAPAIDHVYHFKSIEQIREMLQDCGSVIQNELVLPVEDLPKDEIIKKKITINYCAITAKE